MFVSDSASTFRVMLFMSLVVPTVALQLQTKSPEQFSLHMMTDKGAQCLDGTDAGFYFAPAKAVSKGWQIMFEGGAWCTKEEECVARKHTWLGSSKSWNNTYTKHDLAGIISDDCSTNPDFCNFNRVFVPTCDGTSLTGNMEWPVHVKGTDGSSTNVFFRGFRILETVLDTLLQMGLKDADQVLITGFSSGGLAALVHADYIHETLRKNVPSLDKFRVVPLSGFFLDHTTGNEATKMYGQGLANMAQLANSTGSMDKECIEAFGLSKGYKCIYAPYAFYNVNTPTFLVNPGIDEWQIALQVVEQEAMFKCLRSDDFKDCDHDQLSLIRQFHSDIEDQLKALAQNMMDMRTNGNYGNGAFIHSCPSHINALDDTQWTTLKVNGVSMQEAVSRWWHSNGQEDTSKHSTFDCHLAEQPPYTCNPSCRLQATATQKVPVFNKGCLNVCNKPLNDWQEKCSSKDFEYCHQCEQCSSPESIIRADVETKKARDAEAKKARDAEAKKARDADVTVVDAKTQTQKTTEAKVAVGAKGKGDVKGKGEAKVTAGAKGKGDGKGKGDAKVTVGGKGTKEKGKGKGTMKTKEKGHNQRPAPKKQIATHQPSGKTRK